MSFVYSNGLCSDALRLLALSDDYESRLVRAFGEMGIARKGDTSDEIWKEWKELEAKYHEISSRRSKFPKGTAVPKELMDELEPLGQSLASLCFDWLEYNIGQISKGILSRRKEKVPL